MRELNLNKMARDSKDKVRSMKEFNKVIDAYISDTYSQAVVKGMHQLLAVAKINAEIMCSTASSLLKETTAFSDVDNMSTALLYTLGTVKATPDDTTRDLLWTLIHQRQRRQAFQLVLDGSQHEKKNNYQLEFVRCLRFYTLQSITQEVKK